ncbi:hypothetical protein ADEAN_000225700 [Angomonas deanei]|uniref:Uncharacterized protein n=1 Tax=Angomonas deanei TaxID=59799 RepID=A0A7G2C509_9TRYP|nr:hypothetical protein ADEAN_000225700 [Angomonas deanei]
MDYYSRFFVETINDAATEYQVPSQEVSGVVIDPFSLQDFSLTNVSVASEASNIVVTLHNISLNIPQTPFTAKVLFSTCTGSFWAAIRNMTLVLSFHLEHVSNHTLHLDTTANVLFDVFDISHELDGKMCNVAQSVIEFFMGEIDNKVKEEVGQQLPTDLANTLNDMAAGALGNFTFLSFPNDPVITDDALQLDFDLQPIATDVVESVHRADGRSGRRTSADDSRVSLSTTVDAVQHALNAWREAGYLEGWIPLSDEWNTSSVRDVLPVLHTVCEDCGFAVELKVGENPQLYNFDGGFNLSLHNVLVGIHMIANASNPTDCTSTVTSCADAPVVTFNVSLEGGIDRIGVVNDTRVQYHILPIQLRLDTISSSVGDINGTQLSANLNALLNYVIFPVTNAEAPFDATTDRLQQVEVVVDANTVFFGGEWEL